MPILGTVASQFSSKPFGSFQSIATATGTGSSGEITLSGIPQNFKHLQVRCNMFVANNNQSPYIRFNADSSSNYNRHAGVGFGNGSSATDKTGAASAGTDRILCYGFGWGTVTSYSNLLIIDIYNYSSTDQYKIASVLSGAQSGVAYQGEIAFVSGMWQSTAGITSITLTGVSTFTTDTSVALYGIAG